MAKGDMKIKVAINGFGRIGRAAFKIISENHPEMEVIAINDLAEGGIMAHLLRHDSVYGTYPEEVGFEDGQLSVGGRKTRFFSEKDPASLPWKDLGIDIILECTGFFTDRESIAKHLAAGAKKVVISTSLGANEEVPVFVPGVNEKEYDPEKDDIVSCASCTTNCVVPMLCVLEEAFGIERAFVTSIHSYTSEQNLLDLPQKDLRRARAAAISLIPTTTHASDAIIRILPGLAGKIEASAFRIPVPIVSIAEITALVSREVFLEEANGAFRRAAEEELKGIMGVSEEPLVSVDYVKNPNSVTVDLPLAKTNGNLVRVSGWYDNEWGHASRLSELAEYVGKKL